ncbi:hypothetical protein ACFLIM_24790 [Nonomuraea sp. M3C6]|uniref:HTH lacI-type domain-containing protein n=1 Tax=Nonomuraea marmarensis TaxID=3351344 RepID=A0ABW7AJT8_9ACTN
MQHHIVRHTGSRRSAVHLSECARRTRTVSYAFSRPDQLSDGLRRRILEVADELGYAGPNPTARSLRLA